MKYLFRLFIVMMMQTPIDVFAQRLDSSVHTILFLGNSITYAGNYIIDLEAAYTLCHPTQRTRFINMGLPSETVSGLSEEGHAGGRFPRPDLHERLHRILTTIKPDVVFACYGMNDGIYLPFNQQRFQHYQDGMNWLHDTLVKTGARVIMLTPPVYDEVRGGIKGYANVLDRYADWVLYKKKTANWEVADIHYPMKKYLAAHRKQDTAFALARDGVHPGDTGHWLMAQQLLLYIGEKKAAKFQDINSVMAQHKNGAVILQLIADRQSFMKDAWLTAIGHTRPEMKKGMALQDAITRAGEIEAVIIVNLKL